MQKIKSRNLLTAILSVVCAAVLALGISFAMPKAVGLGTLNADAATNYSFNITPTGNLDMDAISSLFGQITGSASGASYDDLKDWLETNGQINTKSSDSSTLAVRYDQFGSTYTVTFGDIEWEVVYLTTNIEGELVLTLWQKNNTITGQFSYGGMSASNTALNNPSQIYGTSYVRSEVLGNGGMYYDYSSPSSPVEVNNASAGSSSIYSEFANGKYSRFLDAPEMIAYQATESSYVAGTFTYNYPNEAYGTPSVNNKWANAGLNYGSVSSTGAAQTMKKNYDIWKSDKIWLPSWAEVGAVSKASCIWGTATAGYASILQTTNYWLRTGYELHAGKNFVMQSSGNETASWPNSDTQQAIRPAIHLNLRSLGYDVSDVEVTYNGSVQTIDNVAAEDKKWYDSDAMILDYVEGPMKDAGTYKVKVSLTPSMVDLGMVFLGEPDTSIGETETVRYIEFKIKKKGLTVPQINDNTQGYNGTAYEFYFNGSYSPTYMDFTWSDGLSYSTTDLNFAATNAGTYSVYVTLKDTTNYAWGADGSTDSAQKTLPIIINKKELSITARPSDTSLSWQKRAAGTITLTPTVCTDENGVEDTVSLYVYYLNSAGLDYHSPAVTGHVLDVSKITSTGTYTLCAKLIQDGELNYSADNSNYVISTNGGVWEMTSTFEITASGIEAEDMTWYYQKTGDSWPSPLMGSNGQIKLEYSPDINYTITAEGNANVRTFSYDGEGFVGGYKTVDSNGNPVIGGACGVGKYTTYVAVEITNTTEFAFDSDHILDGNSKYGWLALEWEISPRELDFADAEWVYSTDVGTNWTAFSQDGVQVDPEYTGLPIMIKISPDYIRGLGLDPDTDITITYQTNSKKDKGDYTATAEIEISNPSYCTPETADGSDYKISFDWSITNKKIQIKNWQGSQTVTLSNGKAFSVPTIITTDGLDHSSALTYTYECVVDGQTQTATSLDALKAILEAANVSDSNPLTVNISVAVKSTQQDSFTLAGTTSTTCELGDSKDVITVWLENDSSEYGNVQLVLHAEDKDGTDYLQYITITLSSVLLSDPVDPVQGSNYSALTQYLTKTGTYSLAFELSGLYATGFLLDPTILTFEITPKQVYVPEVNREIVFTGENISLINYLDGYDPALMTIDTLDKRDAGTVYTATFTLIDQFNYVFVIRPSSDGETESTVKSGVKAVVTGYENSTEFGNDEHTIAILKWQINPYVLDSSLWNLKGSDGAVLNLPAQFAQMLSDGTLDLEVAYRYYADKNGGVVDPEFKAGSTFYVDAFLSGEDAKNFVFENGTIVSDKMTYSVPKGGFNAVMSNVKDFMTKSWLGLPYWVWLLIALAILILLIIIIVVASKRRKSKEEKAEAKARKEEEKARREEERQRREEERQMQKERLEAERELAKAKQEAELEKIRMQAGMAGMAGLGIAGAGMASMAMQQQPQQQPQPQPQQPVQQAQQQSQPANDANEKLLAEMRAQLAEMRAAAGAAQAQMHMQMPQMPQMPMQQPAQAAAPSSGGGMNASEMMAMMFAQLAGMKADNADKEIAALKSDKEITALKNEIEIMKLKMEHLKESRTAQNYEPMRGLTPEFVGAVISSAMHSNNVLSQPAPAAIPQSVEDSAQAVHAQYPSDAVITTTTTVDTTAKQPTRKSDRDSHSDFTDVDGFYDEI